MSQPHLIVQPVHPALVLLVRHHKVTQKNGLNSPFLKREAELGIYKPCHSRKGPANGQVTFGETRCRKSKAMRDWVLGVWNSFSSR